DEGMAGQLAPERGPQLELAHAIGAELGGGDEVLAEDRQHDASQLRIAGRAAAATSAGAAEPLFVLWGVGEAQRGAVEPVNGQAAPALGVSGRTRPHGCRLAAERRQRLGYVAVEGADGRPVGPPPTAAARGR